MLRGRGERVVGRCTKTFVTQSSVRSPAREAFLDGTICVKERDQDRGRPRPDQRSLTLVHPIRQLDLKNRSRVEGQLFWCTLLRSGRG
jgi:hypothetical protein